MANQSQNQARLTRQQRWLKFAAIAMIFLLVFMVALDAEPGARWLLAGMAVLVALTSYVPAFRGRWR